MAAKKPGIGVPLMNSREKIVLGKPQNHNERGIYHFMKPKNAKKAICDAHITAVS